MNQLKPHPMVHSTSRNPWLASLHGELELMLTGDPIAACELTTDSIFRSGLHKYLQIELS